MHVTGYLKKLAPKTTGDSDKDVGDGVRNCSSDLFDSFDAGGRQEMNPRTDP